MRAYTVACYYDPPKRNVRVEMTRISDGVVVVNVARDLAEDESLETVLGKVFDVFVRYGAMKAEDVSGHMADAMKNYKATVAN